MSRELKFRIWDNEKNEWLAESDKEALTYYGFHLIGEVMTVQSPRNWKVNGTIEQYTGLRDTNGKEIYEGDIVKIKWSYYQIIFNKDYALFGRKLLPQKDEIAVDSISPIEPFLKNNKGEVIGNIHENPELLGGEDGNN